MIRTSLLKLLWLYQRFFSLVGFGSCRYYPSCSEYAKWQFETNNLPRAFFYTFIRILRCNQLFPGGIDYPVVSAVDKRPSKLSLDAIKYWYVSTQNDHYYIIKNFSYKGSKC